MKKILSLDLGITSIGYSVLNELDNRATCKFKSNQVTSFLL